MAKDTTIKGFNPEGTGKCKWSVLEDAIRDGARKMLQAVIEQEANDFIDSYKNKKDTDGHQLVVRNGYRDPRDIITGIGPIKIKQPRIDTRKLKIDSSEEGFTSKILPRYLRRIPSIDNLIPALYLKGISTGEFSTALSAILGKESEGISATTVARLKAQWEEEYKIWLKRDLSKKEYVYFWVDGIYSNVRLEEDKACMLVIIAADSEGEKEFLAITDGYRESTISWENILLDLKNRGIKNGPKLAIGDGALGFWAALRKVYPGTKEQRCWVHKTANILDDLPKRLQNEAKRSIQEMYLAPGKENALQEFEKFIKVYEDKYPKAVKCLTKDKDSLFTFYDFPALHWQHIRTTNPIESTFATIRHRTYKTRNCGSRTTTLAMVYKLGIETAKTWHKLKGHNIIPMIMAGKRFIDGIPVDGGLGATG